MFQRTIRAVRDMEGVDPLVLETLDRLEADFLVQLADIQEEARQAMVKQEEGQFESNARTDGRQREASSLMK